MKESLLTEVQDMVHDLASQLDDGIVADQTIEALKTKLDELKEAIRNES